MRQRETLTAKRRSVLDRLEMRGPLSLLEAQQGITDGNIMPALMRLGWARSMVARDAQQILYAITYEGRRALNRR